jgi:hypothetical protein
MLDMQLQQNERQQERSREQKVVEKCLGMSQSHAVRGVQIILKLLLDKYMLKDSNWIEMAQDTVKW